MIARATIRDTGFDVEVTAPDEWGEERVTTRYFVPISGGYVRIRDEAGRYPQVCEGLYSTGQTLEGRPRARLLPLIRREWARRQRTEAREAVRS